MLKSETRFDHIGVDSFYVKSYNNSAPGSRKDLIRKYTVSTPDQVGIEGLYLHL